MLSLVHHSSEDAEQKPHVSSRYQNPFAWSSIVPRLKIMIQCILSFIFDFSYNIYLITIDDTPTFVVPNTVFGIATAMTDSLSTQTSGIMPTINTLSWAHFTLTVLKVILFNWTNLLVFDLANQRQASKEDTLNKPWRPIPSGRMTPTQMRYSLIAALPLVLAYNHFHLDTGIESCGLGILTWIYNDLGGGDDNWIIRNCIIACAFGIYNLGSMKVAASSATALALDTHTTTDARLTVRVTTLGYTWTLLISGVIFTTMHIQDLKDVAGDLARGRRSAPIVLGRRRAAWSIAVPVVLWSIVCVRFWNAPFVVLVAPVLLGGAVAWRCVYRSGRVADRRTWQLWCAWTAVLYLVPPLAAAKWVVPTWG